MNPPEDHGCFAERRGLRTCSFLMWPVLALLAAWAACSHSQSGAGSTSGLVLGFLVPAALIVPLAGRCLWLGRRLARERARLSLVLGTVPAIVVWLSRDGRLEDANPEFEQLTGRDLAGFVGVDWVETFVPAQQRGKVKGLIPETGGVNGGSLRRQFPLLDEKGAAREFEWRGRSLRNRRGEIVRILLTGVDITDRLTAEAGLERANAMLRQSTRIEIMGTLTSGVAHDFNNILTVVMNFTAMLRMKLGRAPADIEENLMQITKACDRARDLIRGVLAFARAENPRREVVRIEGVVADLLPLVRASLPGSIRVSFSAEPNLPPIMGNVSQLQQVLMNLCINAGQAIGSSTGTIDIAVRTATESSDDEAPAAPRRFLEVIIADSGPGMDPTTMGRIFEPFFTTKSDRGGTGLGLALVRSIVNAHGGTISVSSEPGTGTSFRIRFDAHDEGEAG